MIIPEPISRHIAERVMRQCTMGYILLNRDGDILKWGGKLNQLGINDLQENKPISDQLLFMEGLLPTTQPSIFLAMIKPDDRHCLDVNVFTTDEGYGLLITDAADTEKDLAPWQQKINERALKRPFYSNDNAAIDCELCATSGSLEAAMETLDIAVLVLSPQGEFKLIGNPPSWLSQLCPQISAKPCSLSPQHTFSFLDNFLHDAYQLWNQDNRAHIKSGLWIETDAEANEHLLEATALNTGENKILLISRNSCTIDEKKRIIQKGRELALSHGSDKKLLDELEARVQLHTQELKKSNAHLAEELVYREQLEQERTQMTLHLQQSQKMEAIGTLAGGIAHDLNNILSAVIGFSELSMVDIPLGTKLYTNLQHVIAAGERAKGLIHQILTFSRQTKPEVQPVQLGILAEEALKLLRASLPANIDIKQHIESQGIVMSDPTQMHQIIMNLCTNASQAMCDQGGVLQLRLCDRTIGIDEIAIYPDLEPGLYLELMVKDNGPGIPQDVQARIFEPFFTTKAKGQGTGMGLSVVHGIVKSCKGTIQVTSKHKFGSTFRVLLPSMPPMESTQKSTVMELPKGKERILFIDDESALTELAVQALGMLGYQIRAESDCSHALEIFTQTPNAFDLVITDMNMPKMTGKQLAEKMLKIRPNIPIIICSGGLEIMGKSSIEELGIKDYLVKPVALSKLSKTVRSILDAEL